MNKRDLKTPALPTESRTLVICLCGTPQRLIRVTYGYSILASKPRQNNAPDGSGFKSARGTAQECYPSAIQANSALQERHSKQIRPLWGQSRAGDYLQMYSRVLPERRVKSETDYSRKPLASKVVR